MLPSQPTKLTAVLLPCSHTALHTTGHIIWPTLLTHPPLGPPNKHVQRPIHGVNLLKLASPHATRLTQTSGKVSAHPPLTVPNCFSSVRASIGFANKLPPTNICCFTITRVAVWCVLWISKFHEHFPARVIHNLSSLDILPISALNIWLYMCLQTVHVQHLDAFHLHGRVSSWYAVDNQGLLFCYHPQNYTMSSLPLHIVFCSYLYSASSISVQASYAKLNM